MRVLSYLNKVRLLPRTFSVFF